ncbi:hypothetical protein CC1G_01939 [Coprinopsis cinerea okayama7|uniref:Alpha-ketoglutarate-dependent dioxygenase AlkB-like domain-containing protein n=1 Tax=Coprinopsis cinerea (strain Okayama-7 / 130 / ATCC MYA-4618 / FGSC 9003) TaxID=240176 RepID=A8N611_COPC7|nr:hypothetical protein CC1G_01939 [Coprinopsis cinerea okayama7\|eukprot:XP_001830303.2 hypothetical protein CC1G_01939 [Coprinopsis cinerea okayama7\
MNFTAIGSQIQLPPFEPGLLKRIESLPVPEGFPHEDPKEKARREELFSTLLQGLEAKDPTAQWERWVQNTYQRLTALSLPSHSRPYENRDRGGVFLIALQYTWLSTNSKDARLGLDFLLHHQNELRAFCNKNCKPRIPVNQWRGSDWHLNKRKYNDTGNQYFPQSKYPKSHPHQGYPQQYRNNQHWAYHDSWNRLHCPQQPPPPFCPSNRPVIPNPTRATPHSTWKHSQHWQDPGRNARSFPPRVNDVKPTRKVTASDSVSHDTAPSHNHTTGKDSVVCPNSNPNGNRSKPLHDFDSLANTPVPPLSPVQPESRPSALIATHCELPSNTSEAVNPPALQAIVGDVGEEVASIKDGPVAMVCDAANKVKEEALIAPLALPGTKVVLSAVAGAREVPTVSTSTSSTSKSIKASLLSFPPIWAQTRQEVCETFEWFRSYQGGVYFSNDIVKGYMLGGFGAKRDIFAHGGRLIISHGGGKAESTHMEKGKATVKAAGDQEATDKSVRALLRTYEEKRPLALVIDDRYSWFPFDLTSMGIAYTVLGFYMIVDAWAEYEEKVETEQGRVVRFKFAFQWCEGQGDPWWIREATEPIPSRFDDDEDVDAGPPEKLEEYAVKHDADKTDTPDTIKCQFCNKKSPQVFQPTWACLNSKCTMFWRSPDTANYLPEELEYHPEFLRLRDGCVLPMGHQSLKPSLVAERADGVTTSTAFTRGFHCSKCGRLSCRTEWRYWKCSTQGCDQVYRVPSRIHQANEFCYQPLKIDFDAEWIAPNCGIIRERLRTFPIGDSGAVGQIQTIALPKNRGYLHHIKCNAPSSKDQVNDIFKEYQDQANNGELNFRRWPMRAHKCRGALLTNYFSHNGEVIELPLVAVGLTKFFTVAGVPYHYVGGTENTVPFDQAPMAVIHARELIQRRIYEALGKGVEFNEVLTAAYMESQKMAFHSDDEKGLGPVVAGLSLGSPALMHFRLQKRYSGDNRACLMSFVLRHGDILVMDGSGVQEYYEHTVVPTNFRIAATARFIDEGRSQVETRDARTHSPVPVSIKKTWT